MLATTSLAIAAVAIAGAKPKPSTSGAPVRAKRTAPVTQEKSKERESGSPAPVTSITSTTDTVGRKPDGTVVVPTNQILTPAGTQLEFPGRPFDVLLSPDDRTLFVSNRAEILVLDASSQAPVLKQKLPMKSMSFHGLAMSPDRNTVYASLSTSGVGILRRQPSDNWTFDGAIKLPSDPIRKKGSIPGGLAITVDGKTLCATLSAKNSLGIIDLNSSGTASKIREVPVGIAPYAVILDGDSKAYVSNWAGRRPTDSDTTAVTAGSGMVVDPRMFAAASGTVSVVDIASGAETATIEVGLHPTAMALDVSRHRLYVANSSSDTISAIDTQSNKVVASLPVRPNNDLLPGSMPNALTLSPDGNTLFVANGGNNCVAIVDVSAAGGASGTVRGLVPTAWFPGALALDSAGKTLFVANVKGVGSLAGDPDKKQKGYNSHETIGSISRVRVPSTDQLPAMTHKVGENNRQNWSLAGVPTERLKAHSVPVPLPLFPGEKSVFKHVFYIIKENRTYDQVLGDMPQGNGDRDLCLFGREVTPNHHALAEEFILLDNYYCSGVLSADGHFWSTAAYADEYLEKSFGGWPRSYPYPGDDALAVPPSGFLWDRVLQKGLGVRNFGEMVSTNLSPAGSRWKTIYSDFKSTVPKIKMTATANIESLAHYTHPNFPGFVLTISDVQRADMFIKEFREYEANGKLPAFMVMMLPGDHTVGTSPQFPTPRAKVADNDLALGQIVEAVSHSKFWSDTCIIITEDDPQAGRDHVDAHRSLALIVSPYTRRGVVDSTNYNQTGLVRTMELILGLDFMNQFDRSATPLINCFQAKANLTPYTCKPNQIRIDEMNPKVEALSGPARHWAKLSLAQDFSEVDRADEDTLNRIIWHSVKGLRTPYPPARGNSADEDDD